MSTPSDTPRTDAYYAEWQESWSRAALSLDLCRQLERENTQLAARVKELDGDGAMLDWLGDKLSGSKWADQGATIAGLRPEDSKYIDGCISFRDAIRSAMKQEGKP